MKTKHWGWHFEKLVMYLTPEERKQLSAGIRKERLNYFLMGVALGMTISTLLLRFLR